MLGEIELDLERKVTVIRDLEIEDIPTLNLLQGIPEEERAEFVKKAVILGCTALRNISIVENVDYIQKEFASLVREIEKQGNQASEKMDEVFNINDPDTPLGRMKTLFEFYFDIDKGQIGKFLDPFEQDSPIRKLRDEILLNIQKLRDDMRDKKRTEEIIAATPRKGGIFEDEVIELAQAICCHYEDKVQCVKNRIGRFDKKGDIIIDIDSNRKKRIVIECKNKSGYSAEEAVREITDAIENRDALFGIFLLKEDAQVPRNLRPMKITDEYIVTSNEGNGLYFSLRVARILVEKKLVKPEVEIPIEKIQNEIEKLRDQATIFAGLHKKLTLIDNASKYIRKNLQICMESYEKGLERIEEYISLS